MSASNQGKGIVTAGSGHIATTSGATDVCVNPNDFPPTKSPFENYVSSALLVNGTRHTLIQNRPILTRRGKLGPESDPPHPPYITRGNAPGEPYRQEARPTSGSADVVIEGSPIVRTNDSTSQDMENTSGYMDGSNLSANVLSEEEYLTKICTIYNFGATCEHGRKLGLYSPTSKQGNYLEILSGDSVTFWADRHDTTTTPPLNDPICKMGNVHTKWTITRAKLFGIPEMVQYGYGNTFTLAGDITTVSMWTLMGMSESTGTLAGAGAVKDQSDEAAGKTRALKLSTSTFVSPLQWIMAWSLRNNPLTITVEAIACTGSKTGTVKLFPVEGIKARLFGEIADDVTDRIKNTLGQIRKVTEIVNAVTRRVGLGELEAELMGSPFVEFELAYAECTKVDGWFRDTIYTPARINRTWCISLGFDPLIALGITVSFPLGNLLPWIGPTVQTLVNKVNEYYPGALDIKAQFGIEIGVSVYGSFGQDQYDYPYIRANPTKLTTNLSIGIYAEVAGQAILQGGISFPGEFFFEYEFMPRREVLLGYLMNGAIQLTAMITVLPDTMITWESPPIEPEWARVEFHEWRWDLIDAPF